MRKYSVQIVHDLRTRGTINGRKWNTYYQLGSCPRAPGLVKVDPDG